jgi:hypothetical protein
MMEQLLGETKIEVCFNPVINFIYRLRIIANRNIDTFGTIASHHSGESETF